MSKTSVAHGDRPNRAEQCLATFVVVADRESTSGNTDGSTHINNGRAALPAARQRKFTVFVTRFIKACARPWNSSSSKRKFEPDSPTTNFSAMAA